MSAIIEFLSGTESTERILCATTSASFSTLLPCERFRTYENASDPDLGFWRVDARPSGREQGSQPLVALPEFGWEASL